MVRRHSGHSRLICELTLTKPLTLNNHKKRTRWANLRDARYTSRFCRSVVALLEGGITLEEAITNAGKDILGTQDPRERLRIPRAIRERVRKLKIRILAAPLGSDGQEELITALNTLLRKHRNKGWERLLKKLSQAHHPGDESGKMVKFLSNLTAGNTGPADSDTAQQFKEIFSRNQTRRPE